MTGQRMTGRPAAIVEMIQAGAIVLEIRPGRAGRVGPRAAPQDAYWQMDLADACICPHVRSSRETAVW